MSEKETLTPKAVEFQPDALEIKHERLPWWARFGVWSALIFLAAAILWACLGKVDVIVSAEGKLVTDTPPVVIKPLERSVIKSIDVRIGDVVRKDQVLITFDPTNNEADIGRLRAELSTLTAQFDRLLAEFEGKKYAIPEDAGEDARWQLAIFRQREKYYGEKLRYYDQSVQRLQASQKTTTDSLAKQEERLVAVKKIEGIIGGLQEKNVTSLKDSLEISITRMEMEGTVDSLRNSLIEQEHQEQSVIAERNSFIEEWRNSISQELVKIRRELISTSKQYEKAATANTYDCLRSPCDAMVHEIASFSVGSAVREAEALITLVPLDSGLEVEAEVLPQDIGKVKIGSEARIKLNPFPFQKHGTLSGKVRLISEGTFEKEGGQGGPARSYYRARIALDPASKLRNVGENFRLIPGMVSQAEIKVGRRRVIEYLIHPLIKSLDESIREP